MKKHIYLIISIGFLSLDKSGFSQNTRIIDSLQSVLKTEQLIPDKLNTLNTLGEKLWQAGDLDHARKYADDVLATAKEQEQTTVIKKEIAKAYNTIGIIYDFKSDYSEAMKYLQIALKIKEEIGDTQGLVITYSNIGNVYNRQSNSSEALKNHTISLGLATKIGDKTGIAISHNNIGAIYKGLGDYTGALKNILTSLRIREELGDKKGIASCYINIGNIYDDKEDYDEALKNYFAALQIMEEIGNKGRIAGIYNNIGIVYHKQGNHPEAIKYHFSALKIREEIGDKQGVGASYSNIANIYYYQGDYIKSLETNNACIKLMQEIGDKEGIALSFTNLGLVNIKLKKFREADEYLDSSLAVSKEISFIENIKDTYKAMSLLDSATGNHKGAYEHYKLYTLYKDSLLNEDNNKQIAQMQTIYETEKKDNEIVLLNKDKEIKEKEIGRQKLMRNGFVGGFAVVLLFAGVFFTQRNRISKEKKRSEDLLLNILPSEVAEELKEKGSADAKLIDEVTVLFTDFKGFTSMSEKLSPQELVKDLNECFSAFDNIMEKYGMEKIKTIGDSYMAAGGLPTPNTSHTTDAIKAAFEMRDFVAEGKAKKLATGAPYFEIRIGIHTGPVVAGIVGIKKFQYDIWGDTVNTASRMESSGEAGKINISETTYQLVKEKFNCEYRGEIEAKGKGKVKMYFVENSY